MTDASETKRLARRVPEEIATEGNLDAFEEIYAEGVVEHSGMGQEFHGREDLRNFMEGLRTAFSDFEAVVEDIVAEGDTAAMRVTLRGTHDGPFMGAEATGNSFEVQNMVFTRVENGKIVERWVQPDILSMVQQLGLDPEDLEPAAPTPG